MKTPEDLAGKFFADSAALKKSSTHSKRLAGTLTNLAKQESSYDFTKAEKASLEAAAVVLMKLAGVQAKASQIKKRADDTYVTRRKVAQKLFEGTFAGSNVAEHMVAVIAAVHERALGTARITSMSDLRLEYQEALDSLAHMFARKAEDMDTLVSEAWAKFLDHRQGFIDKHSALILRVKSSP